MMKFTVSLNTKKIDVTDLPCGSFTMTSTGRLIIKAHPTCYVCIHPEYYTNTTWNARWLPNWGEPVKVLDKGDVLHLEF